MDGEKDERFALRKIVTKGCSKINQRRDVKQKKPVNTGFKVEGRDSSRKLTRLMSHEVDRFGRRARSRREAVVVKKDLRIKLNAQLDSRIDARSCWDPGGAPFKSRGRKSRSTQSQVPVVAVSTPGSLRQQCSQAGMRSLTAERKLVVRGRLAETKTETDWYPRDLDIVTGGAGMTAWNYESTTTQWISRQSAEKRRDSINRLGEEENGSGEALLENVRP